MRIIPQTLAHKNGETEVTVAPHQNAMTNEGL